jgi:hypothetical protein
MRAELLTVEVGFITEEGDEVIATTEVRWNEVDYRELGDGLSIGTITYTTKDGVEIDPSSLSPADREWAVELIADEYNRNRWQE